MNKQPSITINGDTRIGEYEPGNGTRYFGDLIRELIGREGRAARRRDIDTIDEYHDLGMRDLTDPFTGEPR